ncbi:precorrin-3B C(17)-methyltransferase [Oscillospiraceae bacterium LTW-04]|nr:precorrin-3B C(17)-methyltransferase [Oscillospiraceae bacterium MB24-C1]
MKLSVVGIGPGHSEGMTGAAHAALATCDLICGYTAYVELVRPLFPNKSYFSTPMKSEIERCRAALKAAEDQNVTMVCSGDAGVYGMAGLLYELWDQFGSVELEVIPGVTAAQSGAALLGAPLMQDYAVVSLSDLLVDWDVIEKRLHGVGEGDFAVVLYNPGSKKRTDHLRRACDILLKYRGADTLCGVAENIGREGESTRLMSLSALRDFSAGMFCTVFIGNSKTMNIGGKMVTLRGYEAKQ